MDIVFSSTAELAAATRAGHVSTTDVLEAHLAQIDGHNPANRVPSTGLIPGLPTRRRGYAPPG